ncbi:hemin uptake protein HemP [Ideonella paludis]|uniref:Hemin uptake protein HemP n=1 Tax=Ideonella paludis TaxID=1233411 RepID=A0ABS5DZW3_9BURK|nr:hemin uptake protein HemP [Ideonella paludis]MBQ0936677.1 hemin uptake protein HemP [Ideonella paludis]
MPTSLHLAPSQALARPTGPAGLPPPDEGPVRWDSALLFKGQQELIIEHHGQSYRLRITALGKLILTK